MQLKPIEMKTIICESVYVLNKLHNIRYMGSLNTYSIYSTTTGYIYMQNLPKITKTYPVWN